MIHRLPRFVAAIVASVLGLGLSGAGQPTQAAGPSGPSARAADTDCPVPSTDVEGGVGSASGGDPYFAADGNGGYDVRSYTIKLTYRPSTDRLDGVATVVLIPREDLERFNLDLVLEVDEVRVDGAAATVSRADAHDVRVTPASSLVAGEPATVKVTYHGTPSEQTAEGMSPNSDLYFHGEGETVAMGEPQSGAWWFPANETPTDKARFDVTVRVPAGDQAVSNGVRTSQSTSGGWTTRRWRLGKPIATYLAFFAAGGFEVRSGKADGRPYTYAVSKRLSPSARDDAFTMLERTPGVVAWLEKQFGPYPYGAIGGVVTGLHAGYALETATRPVYPFVGSDGTILVVHENAHQWFGDDVSVCRWSDVWLNEGFATYAEWLWAEDHGGRSVGKTLRQEYDARGAADSFWDVQVSDPTPADMWDRNVYDRGGMTLAALRHRIGKADLRTLLRTWADRQGGGHGTDAELRALAEQVSGEDLDGFFHHWLDDKAKPAETVENGLV